MTGLIFTMEYTNSKTTLLDKMFLIFVTKPSISPRRRLVRSRLNGKRNNTSQLKSCAKLHKWDFLLFIVKMELGSLDSKHQWYSKHWQQAVLQLPHILQFITCVLGSLTNLEIKNSVINIFQDWLVWLIFLATVWLSLIAVLTQNQWKVLLKKKVTSML